MDPQKFSSNDEKLNLRPGFITTLIVVILVGGGYMTYVNFGGYLFAKKDVKSASAVATSTDTVLRITPADIKKLEQQKATSTDVLRITPEDIEKMEQKP